MLGVFAGRAVRRPGAETAINLAKRRAWYEDGGAGQDPATPQQQESQGDISTLPAWAQAHIKALNKESAERRTLLKKQEEEARQRDQARLAEEGKWKELAEKNAAELAKVQPYQERATALETMIRTDNEARMKQVPEAMRGLIPTDYAPEKLSGWLNANWSMLQAKTAPSLDGGAAGSGSGTGTLSEDERAMARRMGMTDEQYLKAKAKRAQ